MSSSNMVNISDLNRADVLAALYNAAEAPRRMGALQVRNGPYVMSREWAEELIRIGSAGTWDYPGISMGPKLYFDYVYGRCLKVDMTNAKKLYPHSFDQNNGGDGTAQMIVDRLRQTGEINVVTTCDQNEWLQIVIDEALRRYDDDDSLGAISQFLVGTARHPSTSYIANQDITNDILAFGLEPWPRRPEEGHAWLYDAGNLSG